MAFEVAAGNSETPTHTTVASYTVYRLDKVPTIRIRYAETVEDGVSAFGAVAQRQALGARAWELSLSAGTPESTQAMGEIITGIMLKIGRALLTALGLTDVSDAQLLAAAMAIDNIDSFIASALEDIEKARRIGTGPPVVTMGDAPTPQTL